MGGGHLHPGGKNVQVRRHYDDEVPLCSANAIYDENGEFKEVTFCDFLGKGEPVFVKKDEELFFSSTYDTTQSHHDNMASLTMVMYSEEVEEIVHKGPRPR